MRRNEVPIFTCKKGDFVTEVIMNTTAIRELHKKFCAQLLQRQQEKSIVAAVGDVIIKFMDDFEIYIEYCRGEPQAQYLLSREKATNEHLIAFLEVFINCLRTGHSFCSRFNRTLVHRSLALIIISFVPEVVSAIIQLYWSGY